MKSFSTDPIIVPWDFTEMSKAALNKAIEIADSTQQIEVLHVTPYPSSVEPSVVWGVYSEAKIAENLQASFRKEVTESQRDLKFTALFGDPGFRIAEFATEKNAGLIVISSHGRRGVKRLLLGSVTERTVRLSPCPVLVLRGEN